MTFVFSGPLFFKIKLWLRWNISIICIDDHKMTEPKLSNVERRASLGEQSETHYIGYFSSFFGSISTRLSDPFSTFGKSRSHLSYGVPGSVKLKGIIKYEQLVDQETKVMLIANRQTLAGLYPYVLWTTPGNQETKAMLIAVRQTLAGLYPYMLWTTPGNQETKVMLIAVRQTLAGLYPYVLWTTPGNQETNAMLIADRQTLAGLYPYMLWTTPGNQETMVTLLAATGWFRIRNHSVSVVTI